MHLNTLKALIIHTKITKTFLNLSKGNTEKQYNVMHGHKYKYT